MKTSWKAIFIWLHALFQRILYKHVPVPFDSLEFGVSLYSVAYRNNSGWFPLRVFYVVYKLPGFYLSTTARCFIVFLSYLAKAVKWFLCQLCSLFQLNVVDPFPLGGKMVSFDNTCRLIFLISVYLCSPPPMFFNHLKTWDNQWVLFSGLGLFLVRFFFLKFNVLLSYH